MKTLNVEGLDKQFLVQHCERCCEYFSLGNMVYFDYPDSYDYDLVCKRCYRELKFLESMGEL